MSEASSVSFFDTLRLSSWSILSFVPEVREGKPPFIFAMAASGGKIEAGDVKGTVQGSSCAYR